MKKRFALILVLVAAWVSVAAMKATAGDPRCPSWYPACTWSVFAPLPTIDISFIAKPDTGCSGYWVTTVVRAAGMYDGGGATTDILLPTITGGASLANGWLWVNQSPASEDQYAGKISYVAPGGTVSASAEVSLLHPQGYFESPARAVASASYTAPASPVCALPGPVSAGVPFNGACISSSVDFNFGNFFHETQLFSTKGIGPQVDFALAYNSQDTLPGPISPGWTHPYNAWVAATADGLSWLLVDGSGRRLLFRPTGTAGLFAPAGHSGQPGDTLRHFTDGTSLWTRKDGLRHTFRSDGLLQEIRDRNDLALTMGYAGSDLTSLTDAAGRVTTLGYDLQHRLIRVTDPAGNPSILAYGFWGNLASATDQAGQATSYTYTATNKMASLTDPAGNTTTYTYTQAAMNDNAVASTVTPSILAQIFQGAPAGYYAPEEWLATATDSSGIPIRIFHEPGSNRSTVLGRNGGMTTTIYDYALNVPLTVIAADNGVTDYSYDANRNLLSTTDPANRTTSHTYDANGNRLTTTDPLGQKTAYTYNGFGQVTSVTDPGNHLATTEYDVRGKLTKATDASGAVTTYVYDSQGKLTSMTRPGNRTTTFTYDTRGNLATVTDPAHLTTSFGYDLLANVTSATDANGAVTTLAYDNVSRLTRMIDPFGRTTTYGYDPNGNQARETDALGNVTHYAYNAQKKLERTTDALGNVTHFDYSYGGCGNCGGGGNLLVSVTDARGYTTSFDYDVMNRKTQTTDPLGASTWFEYNDPAGNLTDRIDAAGRVTNLAYDALSRVFAQVDPKNGVTSFDFTPTGQTDNVIGANGNRTHYGYDNVGRLTRTESPDTGPTIYGYNPDGTLANKTDANGTTTIYGYDNASRLTLIAFSDATQNVTFSYDAPTSSFGKGRLTGMTDASGATVYHYDALGRTVREEATILGVLYATQYAFDNVGNLTATTYPDGRIVTTTPDPLHRPTQITATLNGSQKTLASAFAFDNVSNLTAFTLGTGITQTLTYDAANRLTGINAPGVTGLTFVHDPVGEIVSMWDNVAAAQVPGTEKNVTYGYQANRLHSVTEDNVTRIYAYDNVGNTIDDGARTFVYNQNQRLIEAWQGGTKRGGYVFDGKGRRVIKVAGGVTTVYHYDLGNRLIGETDAAGTMKVDYVWMGGGPLAQIRKTGSIEAAYYYHTDHLGTPKAMTDNTQTIVWRLETDPFGNEIGTSIKTIENNLRFPGQYYDAETGLHQNYYRTYDPLKGRYVEADPIGLSGGINIYIYGGGNPLSAIDPFGLTYIDLKEGQDVVRNARTWIGVPYFKKGGKRSTRKKADCSGSVWKIYEELDYEIEYSPSGSFPESEYFRPSPGNIPQQGDVGWWDGHMLIYDENADKLPGAPKGSNALSARNPEHPFGPVPTSWWNKSGPVKWYRYYKPD